MATAKKCDLCGTLYDDNKHSVKEFEYSQKFRTYHKVSVQITKAKFEEGTVEDACPRCTLTAVKDLVRDLEREVEG